MERAHHAQQSIQRYTQEQTDALCVAMATAGAKAAHELARLAVEETGIGRVHYKVLKNLHGSEGTWLSVQNEKTVGIIKRDERAGLYEVATPAGVIAGIVPTTNPTSTALNKSIISVKGRNAIVISPHPRAKRCIGETVEVLRRAIERAGGPPDLVQSLSNPTIESTGALMKHRHTALILATGGSGLVKAAYSSGKPAYGVGPGNVPAYVDRSADLDSAARWITSSQSFDNGTFCCSEQALVLDRPIADDLLAKLVARGAHLCSPEETAKLERFCNQGGHMNPDIVGLDPWRVAELAGFRVPRATTILLAHQNGVGRAHPLSIEILCPLLSVHVVDGWEEGCDVSLALLRFGGLGHTIGVWAEDEVVLNAWFLEKPASRIIVNGPTSQGAVGYSTNLDASVSLGCGPQAGNITSDNITARHLVNVKRVAYRTGDWDERDRADHARAAGWTGETAPRGSGLAGDPGLAIAGERPVAPEPHPSTEGPSWRGNPPVAVPQRRSATEAGSAPASGASTPRAEEPAAPPKPAKAARAPRFTEPRAPEAQAASPQARPPAEARPSASPQAGPPATGSGASTSTPGPYVGLALSQTEIQGILAQAGSGCPLGPCQGCAHHDVRTGACTA